MVAIGLSMDLPYSIGYWGLIPWDIFCYQFWGRSWFLQIYSIHHVQTATQIISLTSYIKVISGWSTTISYYIKPDLPSIFRQSLNSHLPSIFVHYHRLLSSLSLPSGNLTLLLKIAIYSSLIYPAIKWWYAIVFVGLPEGKPSYIPLNSIKSH